MAKNSIRDYDNTSGNNTDIQSVDISEGCSPAGINNAIREVMADLADVNDGTVALTSPSADSMTVTGDLTVDTSTLKVDSTNNRVGIGTSSPATALDVTGTVTADGLTVDGGAEINSNSLTLTGASPAFTITDSDTNVDHILSGASGVGNLLLSVDANNEGTSPKYIINIGGTERMRIDSSGQVGIGTSSPSAPLEVNVSGASDALILTRDTGTNGELQIDFNGANANHNSVQGGHTFATNATERMRITSSGNVLVGQTSADSTVVGIGLLSYGSLYSTRDGDFALTVNRKTSDGNIARFQKDGTTVGTIGVNGSAIYIGNSNDFSIRFSTFGNGYLQPADQNGNGIDNSKDIGASSQRWDDIYATNGTIQTSDQNEKQQIASLTDAEITAAKAISTLFKTFKWNDKVEAKGDAARTHTGVIAQDVQQAMTDAGLDAGDYAFFISTTWWETQTEVPAVEAVEAQDAVYDEDGNIVTEAVEAVEAKDAYTRTDTYETAEEAPEGATERTRLGIRYPELLAFVGAATEQRLADIETRLTALEAE